MDVLGDLEEVLFQYYQSTLQALPRIVMALVITAIGFWILGVFRRRLMQLVSLRAEDKLLISFLDNILRIVVVILCFLLFLFLIGQVGIAGSILGAATVSSIVVGFAFKDIAENFLAGVIMAFNRPFRIGDTVKTGAVEGSVMEMSLRDTQIKTFDGKDVFVPNGQIIKNPLFNYTVDGFIRKNFPIGIDYGSDIEAARKVIIDTLYTVPGVLREEKPPKTFIKELAASTIELDVQYWLDTFNKEHSGTEVQSQAMRLVLENLERAGISMPGDIIELKRYKNESLMMDGDSLRSA